MPRPERFSPTIPLRAIRAELAERPEVDGEKSAGGPLEPRFDDRAAAPRSRRNPESPASARDQRYLRPGRSGPGAGGAVAAGARKDVAPRRVALADAASPAE